MCIDNNNEKIIVKDPIYEISMKTEFKKMNKNLSLLFDKFRIGFHIQPNFHGLKFEKKGDAACFDIMSNMEFEFEPSKEFKIYKISTGLFLDMPSGIFFKIENRSSFALKGISVNGGIIDPDYKEEIFILFSYFGSEKYKVNIGDRIAQGVFHLVLNTELEDKNLKQFVKTNRHGGFGSTGK